MELKDREKTLKWLSCSSFETELREFTKTWLPETCEWVTSQQGYKKWENTSAGAPQFLWIFGKPGCGKTFLSHSIRQKLSQEDGIVVYFYFNSKQKDNRKQSANAFYRTIIYQLLKALGETAISADCYSVAHYLRRNTGANNSITNESLLNTLKDILMEAKKRVTIVIDALDECKEDDQEFVERIVSLCDDVSSLKILITSRPELNIVDRFDSDGISSKIGVRLGFSKKESSHDINLYIEQRLQGSKTLSDKMFPEMTREIRKKLRKKADGGFLYVRLMLDLLEQGVTEEGIRDRLECLPETLVGIYQNAIQKIEKNPSKDLRETAKRVLRWVGAARRPLTVDGLMTALRAENLKTHAQKKPTISDLGPFIPNYRERLWKICYPLLEVLEDDTVQVIHVSLAQYLHGRNISEHESMIAAGGAHEYFRYTVQDHIELALTCITYLSVQTKKPDDSSHVGGDGNVEKPEDFFTYATLEWPGHCLASEDTRSWNLRQELGQMFKEQNRFQSWIKVRAAFDEGFAIYFNLVFGNDGLRTDGYPTPIHICAYFGLGKTSIALSSGWWGSGLHSQDAAGRTPLHIAAERNQANFVDTYIDAAAKQLEAHTQRRGSSNHHTTAPQSFVNTKDNLGKTALHYAAAKGNILPVRSLLRGGYSAVSSDNLLQAPLLLAALSGKRDVFLALCNTTANGSLTCASKTGLTPLDCLIMHGHEEILKHLFSSGKVPEVLPNSSQLAFITAARKGFVGVVDLLLQTKIDVNARDNIQQTALHRAATWGHTELVELLLRPEWKVDVDAEDQSKRTPLYFAAAKGHIAIVKYLIQAGANVNALDRRNQTVLFEPAGKGHTAMVKELLGAGTQATQVDDQKRSALHWACRSGCQGAVELLIDAGADLHGEGKEKETLLHWAAQNGHDTWIARLIKAGAKVGARDVQGRTPLHHGASRGMQASVYALLRYGSAPDVVDNSGRTALSWGAESGDLGVVQTLLDAKADITAGDKRGVTPLHVAARCGHVAVLERFLGAGAKLEVKDKQNATPLHFAARAGEEKATRLLLDAGASPIAVDFKKRLPTWSQRGGEKNELNEMASVLNEAKKDADSKYLSHLPRMHQAAMNGDDATVQSLITAGTDIDAKDARGRSALHWAALREESGQTALHLGGKNHHPAVIRQCLVAGADVMAKDTRGQTPLHLAVEAGQGEIVTQLLQSSSSKAAVDATDNWFRTPLHFAAEGGWKAILMGLLTRGASSTMNSGDHKGQTPLHRAARKGHNTVVEELHKAGAKLDVTDSNKRTALHLAARYGYATVVDQLLKAGDKIDARDISSRTALHLAARNGHEGVVDVLLRFHPDLNVEDSEGITPLKLAAQNGRAGVVGCLLRAGAAVATQDPLQSTIFLLREVE